MLTTSTRQQSRTAFARDAGKANSYQLPWWRSRTKLFRLWCFVSIAWMLAVFLFVAWFSPYGSNINDDEMLHMVSIMVLPPFLLGFGRYAYRKWFA